MNERSNSRQFIRSRISIAARITPVGARSFDVSVVDLSMNGILLRSEQQLETGRKCRVMILLGHHMHELPISAEGVVIRSQGDLLAVCFEAVGIKASEEFQSMILFHSEQPEQCLQEFREAGLPH